MALAALVLAAYPAQARGLQEIKDSGVLRHLGVPYANFVTGQGDGLDVELVKLFAAYLGVRYEYVQTDWPTAIPDLIGRQVQTKAGAVDLQGETPVRGDVIANGLTILPWRQKVLDFSSPTFPTQVWLVVTSDSPVMPITPTGDIDKDIALTRGKLQGLKLLCKESTCLAPALFDLEPTGAQPVLFPGGLNDLAPAIMFREGDATLLDVPDAMVALEKYPGKIKIIGPMNVVQDMGLGFTKGSEDLRKEFDAFFSRITLDGTYNALVKKYFPLVYDYFPDFFLVK